jgi:hypothetical protein
MPRVLTTRRLSDKHRLKEFGESMQTGDRVVGRDIREFLGSRDLEPYACGEPGIPRTKDVAFQAVAHHRRVGRIDLKAIENCVKDFGTGFTDAEFTGDDGEVEERGESAGGDLFTLQAGIPVGEQA